MQHYWRTVFASFALLFLAVCCVIGCGDGGDDNQEKSTEGSSENQSKEKPLDPNTDLGRLQGKWKAMSAKHNGAEDSALLGAIFTFTGNKLSIKPFDTSEYVSEFVLDETKSPKHFTMMIDDGIIKNERSCVYELLEDRLHICWLEGGDRPTDLKTVDGDYRHLLELERSK